MPGEARVLPTQVDGHEALTLVGPGDGLRATFIPGLGMVCCGLTDAGEELLALRGGPVAYAERGSSFGIPLLHPWANRLSGWGYVAGGRRVEIDPASPVAHRDAASGLPMHGLLTASPYWTVSDPDPDPDPDPDATADAEATPARAHATAAPAEDTGEAARLTAALDFAAHPALLAAFPFPHRLELEAVLGHTRLSIRLTVTPTAAEPVPISFGFHPYLRLPGSDRETWAVELPVRRRAVFDDRGIPTGEAEPIAPGELSGRLGARAFDDSFDRLEEPPDGRPVAFSVADDRRRLRVELVAGYTVAHVFAPAGSDFICFEPMTAPVDALTTGRGLRWVAPGSSFAAEFAVDVSAA